MARERRLLSELCSEIIDLKVQELYDAQAAHQFWVDQYVQLSTPAEDDFNIVHWDLVPRRKISWIDDPNWGQDAPDWFHPPVGVWGTPEDGNGQGGSAEGDGWSASTLSA